MKKLLAILILSIVFLGCSSDDDSNSEDCVCERNVYELITEVEFDENGLPHLVHHYEFRYDELVSCQEPIEDWQDLGHDQLVYKITCK